MLNVDHHQAKPARPEFGRWLLAQGVKLGAPADVQKLAREAGNDRRFPKDADPDQVRAYLERAGVDGDTLAAFERAETDWLCY